MYNIEKSWKVYNVFLPSLHTWLQENAGVQYCGMSANSSLQIHFENDPGSEIESSVDAKWSSLTEEGELAKWSHYADLNVAEDTARNAILSLDWDAMNAAERKLAMNRPLLDADRESLLLKYPQ